MSAAWRGVAAAALTATVVALPASADQFFDDDLIVRGSLCAGFDCNTGEVFGFDSLKVKENNLRLKFQDTSTSASFPTTDWLLRANDSSNGGRNAFFVENSDLAKEIVVIDASAQSNALYLRNDRVGLGTAVPVTDLHISDGNTPTIRLDQTGLAAFTPQTWDIGGNEVYFFVRDTTNGSQLPLKILPGADTNSLVVDSSGDLIIGSDSGLADDRLLIRNRANSADLIRAEDDGDLVVSGSVTAPAFFQTSTRTAKTGIREVNGEALIARLIELPIAEWQFTDDATGARHIGAMAEDFYAAFGLGNSQRTLSPGDVAGVALGAIKAQQQRIEALEAELAASDERLEALEQSLQVRQGLLETKLEELERRLGAVPLTTANR